MANGNWAACCVLSGRAPAGLHILYETEHCDNPAPDSVGTLSLSHHAMHQMSLTTFHNNSIVHPMCLASPASVSWSVSSNKHKHKKSDFWIRLRLC